MSTVLLYSSRLGTVCQTPCWNFIAEYVVNPVLRIMRAARYCNLVGLSMFEQEVVPGVIYALDKTFSAYQYRRQLTTVLDGKFLLILLSRGSLYM